MLDIDGNVLEGGGQILRIALSLSSILSKPIRVFNIRGGRPKPGLQAQHLKGVQLLQQMCNANVKNAYPGSVDLEFMPSKTISGNYFADTQTAGSIALLLQVALPVALFSNDKITLDLKGGTNAEMAPQIDFITEIFRPNLEKFGATFDFDLIRRGYYPKGGGHGRILINPIRSLLPVTIMDFGIIKEFFGWSFVAGTLPIQIADEIKNGAVDALMEISNHLTINLESYKESKEMARDNCSGINVGCVTTTNCILGGSALGNRRESPYETGKKAGVEIVNCVKRKACIDSYVQDQLIIYMALANGFSRIKTVTPTLHTKTAIYVVEKICNIKFNIIENSNEGNCVIECQGIGYINQSL